jgi:hypothetical protein
VGTRWFCIGVLLVLQFGGAAFGEGEGTYQRTKDGKTIVWNNDPKPGDAATWSGHRDAEGYATKAGTLIWYTARGTVYVRLYGEMVRGKFDGMVNGHSKEKTAHAIFADGKRTTPWAAGPARSFIVGPNPPAGPTEKIAKAENADGRNLPPANRKAEQTSGLSRRPNPEDVSEQAVPGRQRAEPQAPAEGPRFAHPEVDLAPTPPPSSKQTSTSDSKSFGEQQNRLPIKDRASPSVQPEEDGPSRLPNSEQKIQPDDSPKSFTEPPPTLHTIPEAAVSAKAKPRLTSEQVIKLANGEARKQGYNRADYRRDKPQFNADEKTWSVCYEQITVNGVFRQRFSVIVDDKTKEAILLLRE